MRGFHKLSKWLVVGAVLGCLAGCGDPVTVSIGAPSVANTRSGPVTYTITYQSAREINLTSGAVSLAATGTATGSIAVSGSGATSRTVTLSSISGDGTLGIRLAPGTALDAAGQEAPAVGPSKKFNVDNTAPLATLSEASATATNTGPVTFTVTYEGADTINLAQANVDLITTGTATATIDEIAESGAAARTITLSSVSGEGTLAIAIAAGTATDAAGNSAPALGPSAAITVDNTAPTLAISAPSVAATSTGPVDYKVIYEGADAITLSKAVVLVEGTGTTGANLEEVTTTGENERTVTLSNVIGNGTLGISIAPGTATDAAGNAAPAAGPSAAFAVNNIAPTLNISEPSAPDTFDGPLTFTITYADAETITLAPEDVILNSEGGVTAMIAVTGTGNTERTVTLTNINGQGPATLSIAGSTAINSANVQAGTGGPSATFTVKPLLEPGSGFTEATPQPEPIGAPGAPGIDAKAIARWDVVPYQTFDHYFEIGVVAFHINDIDRVEFSVEGGPWTAVREMTLNPRTNVVEYWVGLNAQDFEDGPIEVRAVAYPKVGIPRVLGSAMTAPESIDKGEHALLLNTNANGTLPEIEMYVSNSGNDATGDGSEGAPFLTIMKAARAIQDASPAGNADGGTIYLAAGEYRIGTYSFALLTITVNRWITIQPAPGVIKENVRIVGAEPSGLRTKLVHLRSLMITPNSAEDQIIILSNGPLEDYYYVEGCNFVGPGASIDSVWVSGMSASYFTNCQVSLCRDSPKGDIFRDVHISDIGSDAFSGKTGLIANCTVGSIFSSGTQFHADVLQYFDYTTIENRIVYQVTARTGVGQGFFAGDNISIKDIAFVDCDINNQLEPNDARVFQFGGPTEHLLVRDSIFNGPANWRTDMHFTAHNVVVEDTEFPARPPLPLEVEGVVYITTPTQ